MWWWFVWMRLVFVSQTRAWLRRSRLLGSPLSSSLAERISRLFYELSADYATSAWRNVNMKALNPQLIWLIICILHSVILHCDTSFVLVSHVVLFLTAVKLPWLFLSVATCWLQITFHLPHTFQSGETSEWKKISVYYSRWYVTTESCQAVDVAQLLRWIPPLSLDTGGGGSWWLRWDGWGD